MSQIDITGASTGIAPTRARFFILFMIFVVTTFNYVDRATLSVAAPAIRTELGLDAISLGLAFSAFGWSYTWLQLPGGWVLDRYGSRLVYGFSLILWSCFTFAQGFIDKFAYAFVALCTLRFLMGVAETPTFPANSRLTVMWFPNHERGFATAVFQAAQYFALAAFTPLMVWTVQAASWHVIFLWTGGVGILLGLYWLYAIREPLQHKGVNRAELDYIRTGGGLPNAVSKQGAIRWADVRILVTSRLMIGVYIGQFCLTTITWFFLTWFPTYLVEAKGMSFLKVGFLAAIPALAGFAGGIAGGLWSDWFLRGGYSLTIARKVPIISGLILSSTIVLANYTQSTALVITVMAFALFAKGVGNLGWCVAGDVSPPEIMGISGGIFNFCSNLASIVTPLAVGYIVQRTGSFDAALVYIAVLGLVGALSYLVIVGPLHRLQLDAPRSPSPSATADRGADAPARA